MGDVEDESALCALLTYLEGVDDGAIADRAVARYLARYDDDAAARRQALARLTRMLIEWPGAGHAEARYAPAPMRLRRPH